MASRSNQTTLLGREVSSDTPHTHTLTIKCLSVRIGSRGELQLDLPPLEKFAQAVKSFELSGFWRVGCPAAIEGSYICPVTWTGMLGLDGDGDPSRHWVTALDRSAAEIRRNACLEKPLSAAEIGIGKAELRIHVAVADLVESGCVLAIVGADGETTQLPKIESSDLAAFPVMESIDRKIKGRITAVGIGKALPVCFEVNWRTKVESSSVTIEEAVQHLIEGSEVEGTIRELDGYNVFSTEPVFVTQLSVI